MPDHPAADADFGLGREQLEALVKDAVSDATSRGATEAEAGASLGTGLSVTVRRGAVETLEYHRDRSFNVTVYFGHRKGGASTSDLTPHAIRQSVEKACAIARHTAEDPCSGLADAELMATEIPDLGLDRPWSLSPDQAIDLATECEAAGFDVDERISNSDGGSVSSGRALRAYCNSHGFVGGYGSTSHSISCVLVAGSDDGMERDYWYTSARDPESLESAEHVGRKAAERTVRRLGARKIETRSAPVLFPAELARGLLGHFVSAIRGTSQYRRASYLLDAVGETVFPDSVMIEERPHIPGALASVPFDSEGVATRDRVLVGDGVLESLVLSSYSARKLGLQTTGNAGGVHNLLVSGGGGQLDDLLAAMGTGLLVNELLGQGVNIVTGDYSRGASGFWVEDGRIAYPVSEVTIAGNLKDMLRNLRVIGDDTDLRGSIRSGSILLDEMRIAGD
jgi:PmbA protein